MTAERFNWLLSGHGEKAAESPIHRQLRAYLKPQMQIVGNVAVMPIAGTLAYNPDPFEMLYYGVEDSRAVAGMIEQASADDAVKGGLILMDTPGGMLLGGPEIADAVAAMVKAGKPVVTHVGGLGASLGYMIASQSSKIIANKSALVGSIGVISSVTDWTQYLAQMGVKIEVFTNKEAKFKAAGTVGTSLNDEQRTQIQSQIDSAFSLFKGTVTKARPQVKTEAMQGQVFRGDEAQSMGLIDGIGSDKAAMAVLQRLMK